MKFSQIIKQLTRKETTMKFIANIKVDKKKIRINAPPELKNKRLAIIYEKSTGVFMAFEDPSGTAAYQANPGSNVYYYTFGRKKWAKDLPVGLYKHEVEWNGSSYEAKLAEPAPIKTTPQLERSVQEKNDRNIRKYIAVVNDFAKRGGWSVRIGNDNQIELYKQEVIAGV